MPAPPTTSDTIAPDLARLGLERAPFSDPPQGAHFIDDPARRQRLHLALHLLQHGNFVLLLHGPQGSGKTTLLRRLIELSNSGVNAAYVSCSGDTTAAQLLEALLRHFKLSPSQQEMEAQLVCLQDHVEALRHKSYAPWLLVDDADRLDAGGQALIEQLAELKPASAHIILAMSSPDSAMFPALHRHHRIKLLDLPQFTLEHTRDYLRQRFAACGTQIEPLFQKIFPEPAIKRLHRAARGQPGPINQLAEQRLAHYAAHPGATPLRPFHSKKYYFVGGILGALAITLALVFQDRINAWFQNPNPLEPSASLPVSPTPPSVPPLIPETTPVIDAPVQPPPEPLASLPTPTAPPIESAAPSIARAPNPARTLEREPWLLQQNPEHFALQIYGSDQEADVRRVARRYPLDVPLAYFHTRRANKPWFSLVAGVYPDRSSTFQALENSPKNFAQHAWIRKVSAIQAEIAQAQKPRAPLPGAAGSSSETEVTKENGKEKTAE